MHRALLTILGLFAFAAKLPAQTASDFAQHIAYECRMIPNVTYLTMGGNDLKLGVYQKRIVNIPQPTFVYMHGGFWVAGNKETAIPQVFRAKHPGNPEGNGWGRPPRGRRKASSLLSAKGTA
jgi:acetyl esterase/lipase